MIKLQKKLIIVSKKKLKSEFGEFDFETPRDRNGEFKPKLVPKNKRDVSGIEEKIISLYGRGLKTIYTAKN